MELNNSNNDDPRSAMDLIRNRHQDPGVDGSLNDNEELLEPMSAELAKLLSTGNVDAGLTLAREMTVTAPASSAAALYERLATKFKELSYKMDQAAVSMATLYNSIPKIDYISRLPFDIVILIVDYLWGSISNHDDVTTPTFLYVSKHWRKTILESTRFLSYQLPATKPLGSEKATQSATCRIRTMTIYGKVISFSQLLGTHLLNLQHLYIDIPRDTTSCDDNYDGSCALDACTAIRHNYNLDEVMERCPNLVSLNWSGFPLSGGSGKQYPQLRALQLRDDDDELEELCEKLPYIVVLSISDVLGIDYLNSVSQHCPSLKCLKYTAPPGDMIQWPYEWDKSLEPGIQEFAFLGDAYDEDAVNVIDNLLQASKTLKHLHIPKNIFAVNYDEDITLPEDTSFPHLIHLSCDSDHYDHEIDLFLRIVRCSPYLETMKSFPPFVKWDHPELIELMSSCTRLVNTSVIMDEKRQDLNTLKRFLNSHIQRGSYSALRSLSIALWTEQCTGSFYRLSDN